MFVLQDFVIQIHLISSWIESIRQRSLDTMPSILFCLRIIQLHSGFWHPPTPNQSKKHCKKTAKYACADKTSLHFEDVCFFSSILRLVNGKLDFCLPQMSKSSTLKSSSEISRQAAVDFDTVFFQVNSSLLAVAAGVFSQQTLNKLVFVVPFVGRA